MHITVPTCTVQAEEEQRRQALHEPTRLEKHQMELDAAMARKMQADEQAPLHAAQAAAMAAALPNPPQHPTQPPSGGPQGGHAAGRSPGDDPFGGVDLDPSGYPYSRPNQGSHGPPPPPPHWQQNGYNHAGHHQNGYGHLGPPNGYGHPPQGFGYPQNQGWNGQQAGYGDAHAGHNQQGWVQQSYGPPTYNGQYYTQHEQEYVPPRNERSLGDYFSQQLPRAASNASQGGPPAPPPPQGPRAESPGDNDWGDNSEAGSQAPAIQPPSAPQRSSSRVSVGNSDDFPALEQPKQLNPTAPAFRFGNKIRFNPKAQEFTPRDSGSLASHGSGSLSMDGAHPPADSHQNGFQDMRTDSHRPPSYPPHDSKSTEVQPAQAGGAAQSHEWGAESQNQTNEWGAEYQDQTHESGDALAEQRQPNGVRKNATENSSGEQEGAGSETADQPTASEWDMGPQASKPQEKRNIQIAASKQPGPEADNGLEGPVGRASTTALSVSNRSSSENQTHAPGPTKDSVGHNLESGWPETSGQNAAETGIQADSSEWGGTAGASKAIVKPWDVPQNVENSPEASHQFHTSTRASESRDIKVPSPIAHGANEWGASPEKALSDTSQRSSWEQLPAALQQPWKDTAPKMSEETLTQDLQAPRKNPQFDGQGQAISQARTGIPQAPQTSTPEPKSGGKSATNSPVLASVAQRAPYVPPPATPAAHGRPPATFMPPALAMLQQASTHMPIQPTLPAKPAAAPTVAPTAPPRSAYNPLQPARPPSTLAASPQTPPPMSPTPPPVSPKPMLPPHLSLAMSANLSRVPEQPSQMSMPSHALPPHLPRPYAPYRPYKPPQAPSVMPQHHKAAGGAPGISPPYVPQGPNGVPASIYAEKGSGIPGQAQQPSWNRPSQPYMPWLQLPGASPSR